VPQLIESNEGQTARQGVIRYHPLVDLARVEHRSSLHLESGSPSRQSRLSEPIRELFNI